MARPRSQPDAAQEPRRTLLDRIRDAPKLAASLGAIVALIAGVLALKKQLFPGGPSRGSGEILEIDRDPNVRLGDYLRSEGQKTDAYSPAALRSFGNQFTVKTGIKDYEGIRLLLRWTMFDEKSGSTLAPKLYVNQRGKTLRATGPDQTGSAVVWVPLPPRSGQFFVRFQLVDDKGTILDTENAKPFAVTTAG